MSAYPLLDKLHLTARAALAVVAHPDDESFGLGAILAAMTAQGLRVRVLCFTHGEASSLGADVTDLGEVRGREMHRASAELSVNGVRLLDFPDGHLADAAAGVLAAEVRADLGDADLIVVFEPGGVTGHPDHQAATAAAELVADQGGLPVLHWGLPSAVADALNTEFDASFTAMEGVDIRVDRRAQLRAIRCHVSQARNNPVLDRRLQLLGDWERVRLQPPSRYPGSSRRAPRTFASSRSALAGRSLAT